MAKRRVKYNAATSKVQRFLKRWILTICFVAAAVVAIILLIVGIGKLSLLGVGLQQTLVSKEEMQGYIIAETPAAKQTQAVETTTPQTEQGQTELETLTDMIMSDMVLLQNTYQKEFEYLIAPLDNLGDEPERLKKEIHRLEARLNELCQEENIQLIGLETLWEESSQN